MMYDNYLMRHIAAFLEKYLKPSLYFPVERLLFFFFNISVENKPVFIDP